MNQLIQLKQNLIIALFKLVSFCRFRYLFTIRTDKFLLLVVIFAFLIRSGFILINYPQHRFYEYQYGAHDTHFPIGDDHRYIEISMNFLNGVGFPKMGEIAPYEDDFRRPPIYVAVLISIFYSFGFNVLYICLFQAFVSSLSIIFIYKIGKYYFSEEVGKLAGIFWCFYPASIMWTLAIYRESITVFLLMWIIWSYLIASHKSNTTAVLMAGFSLGVGILHEPFIQIIVPLLFAQILLFKPTNGLTNSTPIHFLSSVKERIQNDFLKKMLVIGSISIVFAITISSWLFYTNSRLGRPVIGTGGTEFGLGDAIYYLGAHRDAQQNNVTTEQFNESFINYRFEIAKKYLNHVDNMDSVSISTKMDIMRALKDPDFFHETNVSGFKNYFHLIKKNPSVYLGSPPGKRPLVKFFVYWLNFLPSHPRGQLVNISTLYTISKSNSTMIKTLGMIVLILSLLLFLIYIKHALNAKLLLFIWLTYFLFHNIVWPNQEPRYTLAVHPLNMIIISYAILKWWEKQKIQMLSSFKKC